MSFYHFYSLCFFLSHLCFVFLKLSSFHNALIWSEWFLFVILWATLGWFQLCFLCGSFRKYCLLVFFSDWLSLWFNDKFPSVSSTSCLPSDSIQCLHYVPSFLNCSLVSRSDSFSFVILWGDLECSDQWDWCLSFSLCCIFHKSLDDLAKKKMKKWNEVVEKVLLFSEKTPLGLMITAAEMPFEIFENNSEDLKKLKKKWLVHLPFLKVLTPPSWTWTTHSQLLGFFGKGSSWGEAKKRLFAKSFSMEWWTSSQDARNASPFPNTASAFWSWRVKSTRSSLSF